MGVPNLANLVPTLSASGGGGSGTPNLTSDPNTPIAAPGSVTVGGNLSVSSGVLNNGTAGAGTFTVTYRLSTSTTYDASGALIGSVSIGGLGAGATATAPFSGGCPNVAAGSYYLVGLIDSSNDVAESNENDNVFFDATPIVVSAGTSALPNLAPYTPQGWSDSIVVANSTGTTVDGTTLSTTDTLYVDFAYVNLSSTTATSASFIVQLYVDSTLVKTITQSAPLGHFYVRTQDFNIGSLSAGTHTLMLSVDPNNSVAESNESDNIYTKTITVNGASTPPPPPPNQVPAIISGPTYAPNSPTPGMVVSFSVAATEAGNNHLTYAWTFGDGATGNGATPTHVFAAAGSYLVTVTVSDGNAGSATGSVIVTVGSVIHTANVVRKSFGLNFRNRTDTFDIVLASGAFAGLGDGTQVSFQIGSQTIDSGVLWRGRASGNSGRFTYNSRSRTIEYSGRNLGLLNLLAPYGVANQTIFSSISIPLSLSVNGSVYGGTVSFRYVALTGKAGKGF